MLNFVHVKYFYDAFRFGSFTEAARRNYVSRPAISQAIRALEENLGEKLVNRHHNGADLTAKGEWFLARSRELLEQVHLIEQQIKGAEPEQSKPVVFCSSRSLAELFLSRHSQESPLAKISFPVDVRLGDAFTVRRSLESNEVDFGIAVDDGNFQSFHPQVLCKGHFNLYEAKSCLHPDHLLIGDKGLEVEVLMESTIRESFSRMTSMQSWDLIAGLASQGLGRAWIPDFMISNYPNLEAITWDELPHFSFEVVQITRNRKQLSDNARTLLNLIAMNFCEANLFILDTERNE